MILVSACLAGVNCNYKGGSKINQKIVELVRAGKAIPICPEQLGGLVTPRTGSRILSGKGEDVLSGKSKLLNDAGEDVTIQYLNGADETLKIALMFGTTWAILKQGSPSCGNRITQGGKEKRELVEGKGVTVALLERNGIKVYSEDDLDDGLIERLK